MDGWMDRWGSGSTSWWYNTVDGVDKDDGVGMREYLGGDTREKETACERKGDSLVAISDNDVSPSARIQIYSSSWFLASHGSLIWSHSKGTHSYART